MAGHGDEAARARGLGPQLSGRRRARRPDDAQARRRVDHAGRRRDARGLRPLPRRRARAPAPARRCQEAEALMRVRKAVIPAAGLGTRFLPATKAVPKEMLPIVDTPTIQLVVEEAIAAGIEEIVLVSGRGKGAIEDHFDHAFELEDNLRRRGKAELADAMARIAGMVRLVSVRQKQP